MSNIYSSLYGAFILFLLQLFPKSNAYLRDIYQIGGVAATCDLESVKRDYYGNLFPLNPDCIIPLGPDVTNLLAPHNRHLLSINN